MNLAFAELGAGNESGFINLSIGAFTNLIGIMQREVPLLPTSQRESFTELFDQYASGNLIGALALNGGTQGRKGALFVRLNRHGMLEEI